MISHKLKEVLAIADTITVLRDGKVIKSMDAREREITEQEIIRYMVGREIENIYPERKRSESKEVVFELRDWSVVDRETKRELLHKVNLKVHKGEIVGIAGLMGAGRTELAMSLFGNVAGYEITSGEMLVKGKPMRFKHPYDAIENGLAYATEDRKGKGLILIQDVKFNISIAGLKRLVRGLVVNDNEEIAVANHFKEAFDIRTPSKPWWTLSVATAETSVVKWLYRADLLIR